MRAVIAGNAVSELWRFRQLLLSLTWRDLRVRYKQSWLGITWAVLVPLSMMLVFTFIFTRAIPATAALPGNMPYALYAYTGLVPWAFFSVSLNGAVNSLVANRNLVTKVYFPREVFPLSSIGSAFADFCIAWIVLAGLMAYFHVRGGWEFRPQLSLLFLPMVVAVQILLTIGMGMLLAMANLFYRDVRQVLSVAMQLWMFLSAVVVPVPADGTRLAFIISLNPLVPLMSAYRDCIVTGRWPEAGGFLYVTTVAAVLLIVGWFVFRRASYRFAECI